MSNQNYKNHRQFVPGYHFMTGFLLLSAVIGSGIAAANSSKENLDIAGYTFGISLVVLSIFFYARAFALKAQDRAIRAEENFRHYILTGKPLDVRLGIGQIVALRFASDAEFPALAQRAIAEGLSNNAIKKAIQNWRADYNRV